MHIRRLVFFLPHSDISYFLGFLLCHSWSDLIFSHSFCRWSLFPECKTHSLWNTKIPGWKRLRISIHMHCFLYNNMPLLLSTFIDYDDYCLTFRYSNPPKWVMDWWNSLTCGSYYLFCTVSYSFTLFYFTYSVTLVFACIVVYDLLFRWCTLHFLLVIKGLFVVLFQYVLLFTNNLETRYYSCNSSVCSRQKLLFFCFIDIWRSSCIYSVMDYSWDRLLFLSLSHFKVIYMK